MKKLAVSSLALLAASFFFFAPISAFAATIYEAPSVAGNWEYFFQTNSPECNSFEFTLASGASDIDEAVFRFGVIDGGNNVENQNVYGAGYEAISARIKSTSGSTLGQNVYGSATVPDGYMAANGLENHDVHINMAMNSSLGPGTYKFEICMKFQDYPNARLKANNNDGYATTQNGTIPYFGLYGTAALNNGVEFTYPTASSTIGTSWRWEWNYNTTSSRAVKFRIETCPYLTSCSNSFDVPATFSATTSTRQGTAYTIAPFSPGNKQALITMLDASTGAELDNDEVFFSVSNTAGSNTGGGVFSTSTQDTVDISCEINLPDLLFGDDSNVDPCALLAWLVIPPKNPATNQYLFVEMWQEIDFTQKQPVSYLAQIGDAFEGAEDMSATSTPISINLPTWFTTGEVASTTESVTLFSDAKLEEMSSTYHDLHIPLMQAGLWVLAVGHVSRRLISSRSVQEDT